MVKDIDLMEEQALMEKLDVFAPTRDTLKDQVKYLSLSLCFACDN